LENVQMPTTTLKTDDVEPFETAEKASAIAAAKPSRFISKSEMLNRVCLSYTTVWALMCAGEFPRSRVLGCRVAWIEHEVEQWILARPLRRLKGDR
jgi:predicted DNA-binding transcriptional regulator AlpA